MKHALLIHSLFLLTPGIPRLFMGDEYLTAVEFSASPPMLDLDRVGVFSNQNWLVTGPNIGLFNYTKQLLTFRYQYSVSDRSAIDD